MKICLISSSGGHYSQLCRLFALRESYSIIVVTEKTKYNNEDCNIDYYIPQVNRKKFSIIFKLPHLFFKSLFIFLKQKPDVVISTGALSTIPMCFLTKMFNKKLIFFESFAKIKSPTKTGKIIYKIADAFYVQWPEMLKFYPKGIYKGGIY